MNNLIDTLNNFLDPLFNHVVMPLVHVVGRVLDWVFFFVTMIHPALSVILVAFIAACLSRLIETTMGQDRTTRLQRQFSEKMRLLSEARELGGAHGVRLLRQGVRDSADDVYGELMLEQFFILGITWFLPMVFFLIWLEYSVFPADRLMTLHGTPFVISGLEMKLVSLYLIVFNSALVVMKLSFLRVKKRQRHHS